MFPFDALAWLIRVRYKLTPPVAADGEAVDLQGDVNGNIKSRVVAGPVINGYSRTPAPATSKVARAVPCALVECWGFNDDASQDLYFQLHNSAALPASGAVPLEVFPVPAGQSFAFAPSTPIPFGVGLTWAVSTTPGTYTAPVLGGAFGVTVAYQ